jgi:hypothetical protein
MRSARFPFFKSPSIGTHVIALSNNLFAGDASLILSLRTGEVLMNSLKTSNTNDLGASVLIDPAIAWDRETENPALTIAELGMDVGQKRVNTERVIYSPVLSEWWTL